VSGVGRGFLPKGFAMMQNILSIMFHGGILCLLLSPIEPLYAQPPDLPNLPPFSQPVPIQRELNRILEERKAKWEWIRNWKWFLLAIVLALGYACRGTVYPAKPVESRKTRPLFFVVGGIVASAGIGLYLFAMWAEDYPLLPIVAIGFVFVGLFLFLPGLPVSNTKTRQ
jgi:hypothetical protein